MGLGLGLGLGLASRVAIHAPAVEALGSRHRRLHKHLARRPPPVARAVAASQRGKADTAVLCTRSGAPAVAEVPGVAGEHGGRGGAKAGGAAGLQAGRRVGIAPACRSRAAACGQGVGATGPVREWCGGGAEAVRGRCRGGAEAVQRRCRPDWKAIARSSAWRDPSPRSYPPTPAFHESTVAALPLPGCLSMYERWSRYTCGSGESARRPGAGAEVRPVAPA